MIDGARQHEQQIRQPIDVGEQPRLDAVCAERHNRSLRSAAHGSREVQQCAGTIATGQNKTAQGRQLRFELIDPVLQSLNVGVGHCSLRDTFDDLFGRIRQPRANRKEILLKLLDQLGDITRQLALRSYDTETCIQFIDIAVRCDARVRLRDACATEQRSAAGIAGARVDLHGRQYT